MKFFQTLRGFGITRTHAIAALIFLTGLAEYLAADPLINTIPNAPAKILMINGVLMTILRFATKTPVFTKG